MGTCSVVVAAGLSCIAASAAFTHATYTLTATRSDAGARDAITFSVVDNTPAQTNGVLAGFELNGSILPKPNAATALAYFRVVDTSSPGFPANGIPDTVDILNLVDDPAFSFARTGTVDNTLLISGGGATIPSALRVEPNPWLNGVSSFRIVELATTAVPDTSAIVIARFVVDDGAGMNMHAVFGGTLGPSSSVDLTVPALPEPTALAGIAGLWLAARRRR